MAEINGGTLYEINQNLMKNEKKMSDFDIQSKKKYVEKYFEKSPYSYFMLLCHDARDYTLFKLTTNSSAEIAAKELIECLKNRGMILSIDKVSETNAFEIWIRVLQDSEEKNLCYYLFNYDEGVIEC